MKRESKSVESFTGEQGRPEIVMELEGTRILSLKLLTGRSGSADISVTELEALAEIVASAQAFVQSLKDPVAQG